MALSKAAAAYCLFCSGQFRTIDVSRQIMRHRLSLSRAEMLAAMGGRKKAARRRRKSGGCDFARREGGHSGVNGGRLP